MSYTEQPGIGRRFDPDELRLAATAPPASAPGSPTSIWRIDAAERLEDPVEDAIRAAVDVERDDDLVAGPQVRLQHGVLCRQAGREQRRMLHVFELGQHRLEPRARRIVRSRVVEAAMTSGASCS